MKEFFNDILILNINFVIDYLNEIDENKKKVPFKDAWGIFSYYYKLSCYLIFKNFYMWIKNIFKR